MSSEFKCFVIDIILEGTPNISATMIEPLNCMINFSKW